MDKLNVQGLESNRLMFRKAAIEDFNYWLPFFEDFDSYKYIGFHEFETAEERCKAWFERVLFRYQNNEGGLNALIRKEDGAFIGFCGIHKQTVDDREEIEIGYSLLKEFRGKGYASEAANACREYAQENKLAESIISIIYIENQNSIKVAEKNQMKLDKQTTFKGFPVFVYRFKI